jgi:VCBS repeat protein/FG-GAP repeat protein
MGYRFPRTTFLFLTWALVSASVTSAQPLSFARDDVASVAGARGIVTGDFDRNGWPDVAQANTGANSVTVLLNHNGTLSRAADIAVGAGPFDLTAGDFNRDGILDLAVANADANSISILIGKGDGTFARTRDLTRPELRNPRSVRAADMTGDGLLDIVASGYLSNSIVVWPGDGTGAFAAPGSFVGYATQPQGIAVADFNHDGHMDVAAVYDSTGGLAILYGTGDARIFEPAAHAVAGPQKLNVVAAGDFNRDGWIDLAAASTANNLVAVYLGGAAGFTLSKTYPTGSSPRGIAVVDVNADGALDLVTANYASGTISVFAGSKSSPGTFAAGVEVAANRGSRAVATADVNQDGRVDLVTGDQLVAATSVLVNQIVLKPGAFAFTKVPKGAASSSWGSSQNVWLADFDRDGALDVATMAASATGVIVMFAKGATVTLAGPTPTVAGAIVEDFNHDGNPDVLISGGFAGAPIYCYLGNGKGAFTGPLQTLPPLTVYRIAAGDLNGDGRPDLILAGFSNANGWNVQVMLGTGNGTFVTAGRIDETNLSSAMTTGDFDRDGKTDLALLTYGVGVEVWHGNGAGGFVSSQRYNVEPANILTSLSAADLNHDGWLDLVAASDEQMSVQLGGPTGLDAPRFTTVAEDLGSENGVAIADVNGDGDPDIVTDLGAIRFGHGDGTFMAPSRFDVGESPIGVSIGDVNGDGRPDIVIGGTFGEAVVLLNSRRDVNRPPVVTAGPDLTVDYQSQFGDDDVSWRATGSDPDAHALTFEWRDKNGKVVSTTAFVDLNPPLPPGAYTYTVTAFDGRGGSATDSMVLTITPTKEIVVYAEDAAASGAAWTFAPDTTAAAGLRTYNPNHNAAKITAPLANPSSSVALTFIADPTQTYKLWVRLKADANSPFNDSVYVQFSGSTDAAGNPAYRQGTTSALPVNLEECSGCGVSGWGWEDDGWGSVNKNGVTLRFPGGGTQVIVIQQREDGVSIDQIVLSSAKYLTTRPGTAKNDHTILARTFVPE